MSKKPINPAKLREFTDTFDRIDRLISELTGNDGIGHYFPVRYVDKLIKARRDVSNVAWTVNDIAGSVMPVASTPTMVRI